MRNLAFCLCLALCAMAAAGCGYHNGFLIPAEIKSVHIRIADNETFWHEAKKVDNLDVDWPYRAKPDEDDAEEREPPPGPLPAYTMESDFTELLKNEVLRRTPLKVTDAERADSILTATITSVEPKVLMRDSDDEVLSERVQIKVSFIWQDRRNGRVLASGTGLMRPTDYVVPAGENFTMAARRSFDFIARQVVDRMQEGF